MADQETPTYQTVTWGRVISPGTIVKGGDGQPWELVSLEQWAKEMESERLIFRAVVKRKHEGQWIERSKMVKTSDPVEMDVTWLADNEVKRPEPEFDHAVWQFPPLTDRKHLESHLFIVHGVFHTPSNVHPIQSHTSLHATAEAEGWPDGTYPHIHTTPKKGKD